MLGVDEVVFDDLKREYEAGKVVVFAGAGIAKAAGLPTWGELAIALIRRMRELRKPGDEIAEAEAYVQEKNLISALSAARLSLKREFDIELQKQLDDSGRTVPELAVAIAALKDKLAGVVTTNLDHFLEDAFGAGWRPIVKAVDNLLQRSKFIFKAHGTFDDPESWVFVRDEYDHVMFGSSKLLALFDALYRARTLLFVGASLTDDDFGLTLGRVRALAGRTPPTHYAILPGPIGPARRDQLERAGIRLLAYENHSGTHHEAAELLQRLAGAAALIPSPPAPAVSTTVATASAGTSTSPEPLEKAARSPAKVEPIDIFFSAAAKDAVLRDKLVSHFAGLELAHRVRLWDESDVPPGSDTDAMLSSYLERARIVLLLISADYIASARNEKELSLALDHVDSGRKVVIPVVLRPCSWQDALRGRSLKPLPDNGVAVTTWSNQDAAFENIVTGVRKVLDALALKT